ncbi:MAG: DUF512 domain-containing protein [Clostridia bacterium]|nr:DUF512 domain-containing protein [Clostridia bacterium]
MVRIERVMESSLADNVGIKAGDMLLSINGHEINDVLDYRFYLADQRISIVIKRDKEESFIIEKQLYDDIGLDFETPLMDKKHRCENKCIFCFIDQLPKGMRETLYFKDDDSRLSFLHGNYITLTNLDKKDIDRIIDMHISPVNVSVHTTNPELRCKMMHNKKAGEVLSYLDILSNAGIEICGQIVLCRGINDGDELTRSLHDLAKLYPNLRSVCVVPSGLTKFRDGLYPLTGFDKDSCKATIKQVEKINSFYRKKYGKNLFFCSDEFYLMAGKKLHKDEYYEDYSQIDNGVGMLTSFECEVDSFLRTLSYEERNIERCVSVATGVASYDFISRMVKKLQKKCRKIKCNVYRIENDYFGHTITVSGLITGVDLEKQLKYKELFDELILPRNMLRAEGDLFLCGTSVDELSNKLAVKIGIAETNGADFVEAILGLKEV